MKEKIKGHYKRNFIKGTLLYLLACLTLCVIIVSLVYAVIGLLWFASYHPLPSIIVVVASTWISFSIYKGAEYANSKQDKGD